MRFVLLLLLVVFQVTMIDILVKDSHFIQLQSDTWESKDFRSMELGEQWVSQPQLDYPLLAAQMVQHEFHLAGLSELTASQQELEEKKPEEFKKLCNAYETIFQDLRYFPIPVSTNPSIPKIVYENGWMNSRSYGGERGHEGCDLMGNQKERGTYPVVSMSDGVVERVGWLEQGGWRIGIRTPSGVYVYYAHLFSYSRNFTEGDTVKAGDLLGFMGDSGYSKVEGAVGHFDVHLHLGIYLKTENYQELSINPYWILRFLEQRRLSFSY